MLCLLLAGCVAPPAQQPVGVPVGAGISLDLEATVTATPSSDPGCAATLYDVRTSTGVYLVTTLEKGCVATADTPENGVHGFYPSPPPRAKLERLTTPVGPGVVFSNEYRECWSSCYIGTDEVAVVTAGTTLVQIIAPSAPGSGATGRDRADLLTVLQSLRTS